MKTLKVALMIAIVGFFSISMNSCKDCKNDDPQARILNNGTQSASVQVKTSGGNTININNVEPGTASEYASYAPGQVTFTIVVNSVNYVQVVDMSTCFDYDISIDANNYISTTVYDRND